MGTYADLMSRLVLTVTSPDGAVTATDDEAATDLKNAAGLKAFPEYRDGEWR